MLRRVIKIFFCFCLLSAGKTFSQTPDTIVVYDYVRVVDTVWVGRQKHDIKTLQAGCNERIKCTTSPVGDTLQFICPNGATFSQKPILTHENQEQMMMKKKGLLTVLLLPFQMVSMGQADYQILAGSSNMWLMHQTNTVSNPVWSGALLGGEVSFPFENSKIEIISGVVAHFVNPPDGYKQIKTIDSSLPYLEYDYAQIYTHLILNELNSGIFTRGYWQLEVPMKIGYKMGGRFNPFVGMAYRYTEFFFDVPEDLSQWSMKSEPVNFFDDFELLLGTDIRLVKNFWLKVNFSKGLLGKHNFFEDRISPTLGVKEYYFKSLNFDVSFVWQIPNKNLANKHLNTIEKEKP